MRKFAYFVIATSLALALAGCGGGGSGTSTSGGVTLGVLNGVAISFTASCFDGTTQTSTVSQAAADGLCPAMSTIVNDPLPVASTYAADSEELAAFNLLNQERSRCGFGTLKQNSALDKAAKAHADYLNLNGLMDHLEDDQKDGFTGIAPWDRIVAAGYGTPRDVTDEIAAKRVLYGDISKKGFGSEGVRNLLNAPFHMAGLVGGYRDIGISVRTSSDVGTNYGRVILQTDLAYLNTATKPELSDKDVLTYPCEGTTGTDYQLTHESPNPVPGRYLATNPLGGSVFVMLRAGHVLTITSATMIDPNASKVTLRTPAVAYRGLPNEGYIVADAPLQANTQYEVLINGTNNSVPFTRQFTFTTGTGG